MKHEDARKLLGGYATGSLTEAEREALFTAALADQSLFDELAREESLRQALDDPAARAHLLAALDTPASARLPWYQRLTTAWGTPVGLASTAIALALVIAAGLYVQYDESRPQEAALAQLQKAEKPFVPPPRTAPQPAELPPPPSLAPASAPVDTRVMDKVIPAPAPPRLPIGTGGGASGGVMGGVVGGVPGGVPGGMPGGLSGFAGARPLKDAPRMADARTLYNAPPVPVETSLLPREEQEAKKEKQATAADKVTVTAEAPAAPLAPPVTQNAPMPARRTQGARVSALRAVVAPGLAAPHLGLRYMLERRTATGEFAITDPAAALTVGDEVRLVFEANDSGWLYVLERDPAGGWKQLAGSKVERAARATVPSTGALTHSSPGVLELYAVLSRDPEPAFANLQPQVLEQRLRGRVLVEKAEAASGRRDQSLYIVNTAGTPQSRQLAFAITLTYR